MVVISVSLPDQLLETMDSFAKKYGYSGRSELIRDAIRALIARDTLEEKRETGLAVILTLTSKSIKRDVDEKVIEIVHRHDKIIKLLNHLKVNEDFCLNIILTHGPYTEISETVRKIRGIRGVVDVWVKHIL